MSRASTWQRTSRSTLRWHSSHALRPTPGAAFPSRTARRATLPALRAALRAALGSSGSGLGPPGSTSCLALGSSSSSSPLSLCSLPLPLRSPPPPTDPGSSAALMRACVFFRRPLWTVGTASALTAGAPPSSPSSSARPFLRLPFRSVWHRFEQHLTSSQQFSHFFRHVNGLVEARPWLRLRRRVRLRVAVVEVWPCGCGAAVLLGHGVPRCCGGVAVRRRRHLLQDTQTLVGRLCGLRKLLSEAIRTRAGALLLRVGSSECSSGALNEATAATRANRTTRAKSMRVSGHFLKGRNQRNTDGCRNPLGWWTPLDFWDLPPARRCAV